VSRPLDQLERLTGTYNQRLETATVALRDGGLTMTVTENNPFSGETVEYPPIPLAPLSEWEVIATGGDWEGSRARFIPGDDDRPRFLRLGGRLVPRQPDPALP